MHKVTSWFLKQKKDYPWRKNRTPYSVWVSEVMLQQTRAEVVLPYFERWMRRFPTVEALSLASIEEVIKEWEGLGYYSRARNLHAGAIEVANEHGGMLPDELSQLLKIKGIGPYTAGAIAAFAFEKRCAFVDGNISRVVARYVGFESCVIKGREKLTQIVEENLPRKNAHLFMEGLIELGQQVCKKKTDCTSCPLKSDCLAYRQDRQAALPVRNVRSQVINIERQVAIIMCNDTILVKKNEKGKVMADLWEFPYIEAKPNRSVTHLRDAFNLDMELEMIMQPVSHSFTKYKAKLFPYVFTSQKRTKVEGYEWVSQERLIQLPFSSGHAKIKAKLQT